MNTFAKNLSLFGSTMAATMMLVSPSFASTNTKAVAHSISPAVSFTVPTAYWDLSANDYSFAFSGATTTPFYSDYYFTTSTGTMYVKKIKMFSENGQRVPCEIGLYDKTTGEKVYTTSFTANTTFPEITYTNLNPNDQYYIGVRSNTTSTTISGNYTLSLTP